jgi:hypothetical protein
LRSWHHASERLAGDKDAVHERTLDQVKALRRQLASTRERSGGGGGGESPEGPGRGRANSGASSWANPEALRSSLSGGLRDGLSASSHGVIAAGSGLRTMGASAVSGTASVGKALTSLWPSSLGAMGSLGGSSHGMPPVVGATGTQRMHASGSYGLNGEKLPTAPYVQTAHGSPPSDKASGVFKVGRSSAASTDNSPSPRSQATPSSAALSSLPVGFEPVGDRGGDDEDDLVAGRKRESIRGPSFTAKAAGPFVAAGSGLPGRQIPPPPPSESYAEGVTVEHSGSKFACAPKSRFNVLSGGSSASSHGGSSKDRKKDKASSHGKHAAQPAHAPTEVRSTAPLPLAFSPKALSFDAFGQGGGSHLGSPPHAILNGAKVWVSSSRPALATCGSLLRAMHGLLSEHRPLSPLPPPPLPFGEESPLLARYSKYSSGGAPVGVGVLLSGADDLASLGSGAPTWSSAMKGLGKQGLDDVRASGRYRDLCLDLAELQKVDLAALHAQGAQGAQGAPGTGNGSSSAGNGSSPTTDKAAKVLGETAISGAPGFGGRAGVRFYLGLLNLLAMHAVLAFGGPTKLERLADQSGKLSGKVAYDVGGQVLTLAEVQFRLALAVHAAATAPAPSSATAHAGSGASSLRASESMSPPWTEGPATGSGESAGGDQSQEKWKPGHYIKKGAGAVVGAVGLASPHRSPMNGASGGGGGGGDDDSTDRQKSAESDARARFPNGQPEPDSPTDYVF